MSFVPATDVGSPSVAWGAWRFLGTSPASATGVYIDVVADDAAPLFGIEVNTGPTSDGAAAIVCYSGPMTAETLGALPLAVAAGGAIYARANDIGGTGGDVPYTVLRGVAA